MDGYKKEAELRRGDRTSMGIRMEHSERDNSTSEGKRQRDFGTEGFARVLQPNVSDSCVSCIREKKLETLLCVCCEDDPLLVHDLRVMLVLR